MTPDEPELPPQEQPDTTPSPEIEPFGTPEEIPLVDPSPGEGDLGQPIA